MKKKRALLWAALALSTVFACAAFAGCNDNTGENPGGNNGGNGGNTDVPVATAHDFVFEAEHTDLTKIQGAGKSNALEGVAVITYDKFDAGASNDYFVGYLYIKGNVVTFNIHSDKDVSGVKLTLRATAEAGVSEIDKDDMLIAVNGENVTYRTLTFNGVKDGFFSMDSGGLRAFSNHLISNSIDLHEGDNTITFTVVSTEAVDGTASARACILDCITLTTPEDSDAELTMEKNAMSLQRIDQLENE